MKEDCEAFGDFPSCRQDVTVNECEFNLIPGRFTRTASWVCAEPTASAASWRSAKRGEASNSGRLARPAAIRGVRRIWGRLTGFALPATPRVCADTRRKTATIHEEARRKHEGRKTARTGRVEASNKLACKPLLDSAKLRASRPHPVRLDRGSRKLAPILNRTRYAQALDLIGDLH